MATFRCVFTAKQSYFEASLDWGKQALIAYESLPEPASLRDVHRASALYATLARQLGTLNPLLAALRARLLKEAEVCASWKAIFTQNDATPL
jgi:hypothetical protein